MAVLGLVLATSLTWLLVHQATPDLGATRPASIGLATAGSAQSGAAAGSTQPAPQSPASSAPGSTSSGSPTSGSTTSPSSSAYPTFVVVRPQPSGDLDVVEEVFKNAAVSDLHLTVPTVGSTRGLKGAKPAVSELSVLADGRRIAVPNGGRLSSSATLRLGAPSSTITLTYRLSGAAVHTGPGPQGRVLALLPTLSADRSTGSAVIVRVVGPGVLSLICTQQPVAKQLCGHHDGDQWTTPSIPARTGRVVAQLDLSSIPSGESAAIAPVVLSLS